MPHLIHSRYAPPAVVVVAHLAVAVMALYPLFVVDIPALVDYPNHLARMRVIAEIGINDHLGNIYSVDWSLLPNLAMDVIVPWLAQFIGIIAAGKFFIGMTLLLHITGTTVLHRVLYGRVGLWPLAANLVLFNFTLSFGFLNYLFGIGLFLFLFAFWLSTTGWTTTRRVPIASVACLLLYICHLAAFATFALCVASHEVWRWYRARPRSLRSAVGRAVPVVWVLAPTLLLFAFSNHSVSTDQPTLYQIHYKSPHLATHLYGEPIDLAVFVAIAAAIMLMWRSIRFSSALLLPVASLALSVLIVPTWLFDNFGNDFRLLVPLAFLIVAGTEATPSRQSAKALAGAAMILMLGRFGYVLRDWTRYDELYAELRSAADQLDPGARVLPAVRNWSDVDKIAPTDYGRVFANTPALLVLEQPVFVPTLFTAGDRQLLRVRQAYSLLDVPYSQPVPLTTLIAAIDLPQGETLNPTGSIGRRHFDRFAWWPDSFDYVLMLDFGYSSNRIPDHLEPVVYGSYFTIYAVTRNDEPLLACGEFDLRSVTMQKRQASRYLDVYRIPPGPACDLDIRTEASRTMLADSSNTSTVRKR